MSSTSKILALLFLLGFTPHCAKYGIKGGAKANKSVNGDANNFNGDPGGRVYQDGDAEVYESNDGKFQFRATPRVTGIGTPVVFTASCYGDPNARVDWNLGDGTMQTGLNLAHSYQAANSYTVHATCYGPNGETRQGDITVQITTQVLQNDCPQTNSQYQQQNNNCGCCCCCCCCCRSNNCW